MKKLVFSCTLLALAPGGVQAGVILGTSPNAVSMKAGATISGGATDVSVVGDGSTVMAAWTVTLDIAPLAGASGTVSFVNPTTPTNYIFSLGAGIAVNQTNPTHLSANDFDLGGGTLVPATGANLLQLDLAASSNASGSFGIYAEDGLSNLRTYFNNSLMDVSFANIPDDSNSTLIGTVLVTPARVPEPTSLALGALGSALMAGCRRRWNRLF
jgi:hypothetical protein